MRLKVSKSKNAASLYVIKSTYLNGVHSTKIVEKLGTEADLREKLHGADPYEWANEYIKALNKKEQEQTRKIFLPLSQSHRLPKDEQHSFHGGYLFLQSLYHQLGLPGICSEISKKYKFTFDLNAVLSRLLYARILFPCSKLATFQLSSNFLESADFEIQHVYRALEVIAKETNFIQASVYKNSLSRFSRNTKILYYDCTNYFFEIEQEQGLKQYGYSKEHRPNPLVQMGLFMDGDGIPLAFHIDPGNLNEQQTLQPLERKLLTDFHCSKFIVCTDAGLASTSNRQFNDRGERAFLTTQSIKKLKSHLKSWALDPTGWSVSGSEALYNLADLTAAFQEKADSELLKKTFYKERWIKEDGLEQRLIVTFSFKYQIYQRRIRNAQLERANKLLHTDLRKLKKCNANDYKRFIQKTSVTADGEIAEKDHYAICTELITQEEQFDGFYGVCTNLESDVSEIIKINKNRWEIEECFRIMKSEFKARPVYLSRDDRIAAHFTTCFLALLLYRLLEKKLNERYTCHEIIQGLHSMNFYEVKGEGYIPTYTRTDLTDDLHDAFGFRTDYQIVSNKQMKNIFKTTKLT